MSQDISLQDLETFKVEFQKFTDTLLKDIAKSSDTVILNDIKCCTDDIQQKIWANLDSKFEQFKKDFADVILDIFTRHNPYNFKLDNLLTVFPDKCKFFLRGADSCFVVIVEDPAIRTISFDSSWHSFNKTLTGRSFSIAFPYVVFVFAFSLVGKKDEKELWSFQRLHTALSKMPIVSIDDVLYDIPLPNLNGTSVCLGRGWQSPNGTIADQVHFTINNFWTTYFHFDEWYHNFTNAPSIFRDIKIWESKSKEDPLFVLHTNYNSHQSSIKSILKQINLEDDVPFCLPELKIQEATRIIVEGLRHCKRSIEETGFKTNYKLIADLIVKMYCRNSDKIVSEIVENRRIKANLKKERNQKIRLIAADLWEKAGKPEGRDKEIWFAAEEKLKEKERKAQFTKNKETPDDQRHLLPKW